MPIARTDVGVRQARIDRMIEPCCRATLRRLLRRATRRWRQAEPRLQPVRLETPPERAH